MLLSNGNENCILSLCPFLSNAHLINLQHCCMHVFTANLAHLSKQIDEQHQKQCQQQYKYQCQCQCQQIQLSSAFRKFKRPILVSADIYYFHHIRLSSTSNENGLRYGHHHHCRSRHRCRCRCRLMIKPTVNFIKSFMRNCNGIELSRVVSSQHNNA